MSNNMIDIEALGLQYKDPPNHVSVSQIRKFRRCELSWFFDYMTTAPKIYPSRMLIGSAIHKGFETASEIRIRGTDIDALSIDVCNDSAIAYLNQQNLDEYIWDTNVGEAESLLKKIGSNAYPNIKELPMPIFSEYNIEGYFLGPLELSARLDLMCEDGSIWDYKIGAKHKTEVDLAIDIQLGLYSYCMGSTLNGFVSVSNKTGITKIVSKEADAKRNALIYDSCCATAETIYQKTEDLNAIFAPNTEGWWCGKNCEFCNVCPYAQIGEPY